MIKRVKESVYEYDKMNGHEDEINNIDNESLIPFNKGLEWAITRQNNLVIIDNDLTSIGIDILKNEINKIDEQSEIICISKYDDISSTDYTNKTILIVNNLIDWSVKDQRLLSHYINDQDYKNADDSTPMSSQVVIIGVVPSMAARHGIIDWLLHKFWICCSGVIPGTAPPNLVPSLESEETPTPTPTPTNIETHINHNIIQYIKDIMVHLRIHRLVVQGKGGGIHTNTLTDLILLSQCIAQDISQRNFVVPEDIKLACKWYLPWHLQVRDLTSLGDASLLYGSRPQFVEQYQAAIVATTAANNSSVEQLIVRDVLKRIVPPV